MTQLNTQKGFTLVELAIVMTIIGLLIGGILKGQELMSNARVTATVAQIKGYDAAATTFRDKYEAIPGDMVGAATRLPGCTGAPSSCTAAVVNGSVLGDNKVGSSTWNGTSAAQNANTSETELFWTHLLLSDLISGVTTAPIQGAAVQAFGAQVPASRFPPGGFIVGQFDGNVRPLNEPNLAGTSPPAGMVLMLVSSLAAAPGGVTGQQPLSPVRAAQIDRKMDDGVANTGSVHAYGTSATCFNGGAAPATYVETSNALDCGLIFRIQG